jgi:hypothetical protein
VTQRAGTVLTVGVAKSRREGQVTMLSMLVTLNWRFDEAIAPPSCLTALALALGHAGHAELFVLKYFSPAPRCRTILAPASPRAHAPGIAPKGPYSALHECRSCEWLCRMRGEWVSLAGASLTRNQLYILPGSGVLGIMQSS